MLDELYGIHKNIIKNVPYKIKRYLFKEINWKANTICLTGARGTGKTTLLLQYYLEKYSDVERCLYLSADHITVVSHGLYKIAQEYFKYGGEAIIIDEVHKYTNWSQEVKNIIDTFKNKQILISGSSSLNLIKGKYDLSRRITYYELKGLSFREYLLFKTGEEYPVFTLSDILKHHVHQVNNFLSQLTILKLFKHYLLSGYYPFFLEGENEYLNKLLNVIEKVLFEDIGNTFSIHSHKLTTLKKILWLIATSHPFIPNIEKMSRELNISKEYIYNYLEYLELSNLIMTLHFNLPGYRFIRKPGKIYIENTNLLHCISGSIKMNSLTGTERETFFVNQLIKNHKINLHPAADFLIDDQYTFEVGGISKNKNQIKNLAHSYLVKADIEIGSQNTIPLYLFGFLY